MPPRNLTSRSAQVERIRVLLMGEEALVRAALHTLLNSWRGFEVIGEAATKNEALEQIRQLNPRIVLLSWGDDDSGNLQAVQDLAKASNYVRIVVLMGDGDPRFRTELVRHGARGVVSRKKAAGELRKAIRKIHESDEIWLDRASLGSLIIPIGSSDRGDSGDKQLSLLNERERAVVDLVVQGLQNNEIARRLSLSGTTVRHHLTTIFNKLGKSNRFELIAYMHRRQGKGAPRP